MMRIKITRCVSSKHGDTFTFAVGMVWFGAVAVDCSKTSISGFKVISAVF